MDNGPELISQRLESWAQERQIELLHIQPGKPAQNAYNERLNRTYSEEALNAYLFDTLRKVRQITEQCSDWQTTIPSVCMRPYWASRPASLFFNSHDFIHFSLL